MNTHSDQGRCACYFPGGRRCQQSVAHDNAEFCATHARRLSQAAAVAETPLPVDEKLVTEIVELAGDFSSPERINRAMGKIFDSLLHRRITPKEAGTLCYIAQTILNSQRTVTFIEKSKPRRGRTFINDLPTAIRD